MTLDLQEVQAQLKAMKVDGWLLYDFQGLNPIARKLLGLQEALLTRRWFCWIPSQGSMTLLCHRIERQGFDRLPASTVLFSSWEEMQAGLERLLQGSSRVAMEYSPLCSIPYVSRVDAGTLELVRALGKTVVSSADLVQYFEARWSQEQLQTHLQASRLLMDVLFATFEQVREATRNRSRLTEHQLQQSMCRMYRERGLESSSPPIVAVNRNSGNPHYEPRAGASTPIRPGDLLLIDFWAKLSKPQAVYADYTWVAFLGEAIPASVLRVWGSGPGGAGSHPRVRALQNQPGDGGAGMGGRPSRPPGDRGGRIRPVFHPPDRPQHRGVGPRQRSQTWTVWKPETNGS